MSILSPDRDIVKLGNISAMGEALATRQLLRLDLWWIASALVAEACLSSLCLAETARVRASASAALRGQWAGTALPWQKTAAQRLAIPRQSWIARAPTVCEQS